MLKMTAKQTSIVNKIKDLEKEHGCTIYLRYNPISKKIHPIRIDDIQENEVKVKFFPAICSHNVAMTMESKNIAMPADEELKGFKALKLNEIIS
ncbi:hypothetical protein D3C86_821190 [compost metagenome]